MIYSRKHNYIFIHIPKTGGTSLARALEARAAADDIMLGDTPKARKRRHRVKGVAAAGRLWKHSMLSDIVGLVTPEQIAQARVFTMVRNPWDRVVSYYHSITPKLPPLCRPIPMRATSRTPEGASAATSLCGSSIWART